MWFYSRVYVNSLCYSLSDRAIHFFFASSLTWWIWNYCIDESVPFWLMWLIYGGRTIQGAGMRGAKGAEKLVHLKRKSSLSDHPDHQLQSLNCGFGWNGINRKSFFSWLKKYCLCRRKKTLPREKFSFQVILCCPELQNIDN